jgi:Na+/melibiose symporter-like transporter
VPYLALIPEMAIGYDERGSLNTYRTAARCSATAAAGMKGAGGRLGGDAAGLAQAAWILAFWLALLRGSRSGRRFERRSFAVPGQIGFRRGAKLLAAPPFRSLAGLYLYARIAVDLIGAVFCLTSSIGSDASRTSARRSSSFSRSWSSRFPSGCASPSIRTSAPCSSRERSGGP